VSVDKPFKLRNLLGATIVALSVSAFSWKNTDNVIVNIVELLVVCGLAFLYLQNFDPAKEAKYGVIFLLLVLAMMTMSMIFRQ